MRRLASVRMIEDVQPIYNSDFLEVVRVDGWKVVVRKNEFKVGDEVVYFEIDSVLPERPEFEFLRDRCWVDNGVVKGFRIKTIKLRKQISQGLVIPNDYGYEVGSDVTEAYGVVLFDGGKSIPFKAKGRFPHFIQKTDQERIQNINPLDIWGDDFEVTVKYDGASITTYFYDGEVGVCSRNYELKLDGSAYDVASKPLRDALVRLGENVAVQGELMGPKIQNNNLGLTSHRIYVFDVYDIDKCRYMLPEERYDFLNRLSVFLDIELLRYPNSGSETISCVPFVVEHYPYLTGEPENYKEAMLDWVEKIVPGEEGIVLKSYDTPGLSFKVISNKYLLGEK